MSRTKVARHATQESLVRAALAEATDAQFLKLNDMLAKGWRVLQTDCILHCDSIIWVSLEGKRRAIRPDGTLFFVSPGFKSLPLPREWTPRLRSVAA